MSDTVKTPPSQDPLASKQRAEKEERERRIGAFWWWRVGAGFLIAAAVIIAAFYYGGYFGKRSAEKQKVENAYVFRIDGRDKQSRNASFDFIILTEEYTWVKGSTNQVTSHGQVVPDAEVVERVITPRMRNLFAKAPDLIAVGLASSEGDRAQEEARANQRAETVSAWMEKFSNPPTRVWKLTLGQYDKQCRNQEDADTSFERPLIMVAVRSKDAGANLQEALANAISGLSNLPDRSCYSRFDFGKAR